MKSKTVATSATTPNTALRHFCRSVALASRHSRWLLAVAALTPMSMAWGYSVPQVSPSVDSTTFGIGQLPHGTSHPFTGARPSCGIAFGAAPSCHAVAGTFTGPEFSISLPSDVAVFPEGTTTVTISFSSSGTRQAGNGVVLGDGEAFNTVARFGFNMRAEIGTFPMGMVNAGVRYYQSGSRSVATHDNPVGADASYAHDLHWESPDDVADQARVDFNYCAQAVNGDGDSTGDGPSICGRTSFKVNVAPEVSNQDVAVAMNASAPVDFVLRVSGGVVDVDATTVTVTAVPAKGAVTDHNGDAVAVDAVLSLTVTDSSASVTWQYLPNASASGADSMVWTVTDGQAESRATVSFSINEEAPAPAPAAGGGGGGGGGGCALSLDAAPAAPASGLLLAALLAMLWRRRRAGLGGGRACRVAPPAG